MGLEIYRLTTEPNSRGGIHHSPEGLLRLGGFMRFRNVSKIFGFGGIETLTVAVL